MRACLWFGAGCEWTTKTALSGSDVWASTPFFGFGIRLFGLLSVSHAALVLVKPGVGNV